MTAADPSPTEREPGQTYRFDAIDGDSSWELGWDHRLGAFFAHEIEMDVDGTILGTGTKIYELAAIERLAEHIGQPIPADVTRKLYQDALAFPPGPDPSAVLADWATSVYLQLGITPRWSLPAAPVIDILHTHAADGGNRDPQAVGTGFGFDAAFVGGLLDGTINELSITQIAHVCEVLRCSPFDMWRTDAARSILHTYGPEDWPRYIEPLGDHEAIPTAQTPAPERWELPVSVGPGAILTPYRSAGYLTVNSAGHPVDPWQVANGEEEFGGHQPVFAQTTEPRRSSLPLETVTGAAGAEVDPRLATMASALQQELEEPYTSPIELLRLAWPGHEAWLGWNRDTQTWERRNDPRDGYAGPPTDILDTNGLTGPDQVLAEAAQPRSDRFPPSPIAEDPRWPPGSDVIVTGYRRTALLAVDRSGRITEVPDTSGREDTAEYHDAFTQVTRPSTYALFGYDPRTAGEGVDPLLASVASYRVNDADTGRGGDDANVRIDLVRISPTVDGRFAAEREVWLGWHPETGSWELRDDPRHLYPGPPGDVLDPGEHVTPEQWDAAQERMAIDIHDTQGIPELHVDDTSLLPQHATDPWLPEPPEPPSSPELEL